MSGTIHDADHKTMRKLSGLGEPLACRWCARCDSHYRFCGCDEPAWRLRSDGKLGPLPGELGGPHSLNEEITGKSAQWPNWNG